MLLFFCCVGDVIVCVVLCYGMYDDCVFVCCRCCDVLFILFVVVFVVVFVNEVCVGVVFDGFVKYCDDVKKVFDVDLEDEVL